MRMLRQLRDDQAGAAIVEFALVAPTMILLMMGVFELGHTMYVQSVVNGAMRPLILAPTQVSPTLECTA